jgi:sec-independent protein translocase protein TatB
VVVELAVGRPQVELEVPRERGPLEPVEQRDEAAVPVEVAEVDAVDPEIGQTCRPPFGTFGDLREAGRVDEPDTLVDASERREWLHLVVAQPRPWEEVGRLAAEDVEHRLAGPRCLEVERELEIGATRRDQLRQRRDVVGELVAVESGDRYLAEPSSLHLAVVVEDHLVVRSEPHVALQTRGTQLQGQLERLDRVLGRVGPRAAVREHDRRVEQGGESLLHAPPSCQTIGRLQRGDETGDPSATRGTRRLADVFNFQGSELIIILLLALVVLGPEKLPEAMRRLGRFYADLKKMSTGFQEEFRAAVDEPTRELRDTANTLRDSLDFRKLQDGERTEKPKSADMTPADPTPDTTPDTTSDTTPDTTPDTTSDTTPTTSDMAPADPDAVPTDEVPFRPDDPHPDPEPRPQVAVDDEHGLREARSAPEDGAA